MKLRAFRLGGFRKSLAVLTCLALFMGTSANVFAQASTGAIAGVILDPSGKPASGFKVVLHDMANDKDFTSEPTDAQGNYSASVPIGGRYKVQEVIASDGVTKLPVQDIPPVSVLTAGTTRLNVRFKQGAAPGSPTTATASNDDHKKDKGAVPWYKRPGPIVGMVLGGAAILALALSGGGSSSNGNASPSAP